MDENNNDGNWQMPPIENPFSKPRFYVAYFVTISFAVLVSLFIPGSGNFYEKITNSLSIFFVPYAIVGLIAWLIVRKGDKVIALGILLGSLTPFVVVIANGGCYLH